LKKIVFDLRLSTAEPATEATFTIWNSWAPAPATEVASTNAKAVM
jgi:hypothetical protein